MSNIISIDIGGTKISAALYDNGHLSFVRKTETRAERGPNGVIDTIFHLIDEIRYRADLTSVSAIGVACPGPLVPSTGIVVNAPTLGWKMFPLKDKMENMLQCPVKVENDANAAAWGEHLYGAGVGCPDMAYITISTGVGCGIIVNGQIAYGKHESAGELGHLHMVDNGEMCVCGRKGCLEAYASGTGIAKIASKELGQMDSKQTAEAARCGNMIAISIFEQAGKYLGQAIANLEMLLDTDLFVIGGSVSSQLDLMMPSIMGSVEQYSYWANDTPKRIVLAQLGEHSGLIGAGALATQLLLAK